MSDLKQALDQLAARKFLNRFDRLLADRLSPLPLSKWSAWDQYAVWFILEKYESVLTTLGFDYAALPKLAPPPSGQDWPECWIGLSTAGTEFVFQFPRNEALNDQIRQRPGRRFDPKTKQWLIPANATAIDLLLDFAGSAGFAIDGPVLNRLAQLSGLFIPGLGGKLRPYQIEVVQYALQHPRTFLADDPLLGKTIEALAVLQAANAFPAVIVCPLSQVDRWLKEVQTWLPGRTVSVLDGHGGSATEVMIIHYDGLKRTSFEHFKQNRPLQAVVFDDAHRHLINLHSARSQACLRLASGVRFRLALANPVIGDVPADLIGPLHILDCLKYFGGRQAFIDQYCGGERAFRYRKYAGATDLAELHAALNQHCFVRTPLSATTLHLPELKYIIRPIVTLSNLADYRAAEYNTAAWLHDHLLDDPKLKDQIAALPLQEQHSQIAQYVDAAVERFQRSNMLGEIGILRRLAGQGKIEAACAEVAAFIATGRKLVVFAYYTETIKELARRLEAPLIDGDTTPLRRQKIVERFQTDPATPVVVVSLSLGQEGLALTAAQDMLFVELDYQPIVMGQAERRCFQIDQSSTVNVRYLLGGACIDLDIYERLIEKQTTIDRVMNDTTGPLVAITRHMLHRWS